MYDGSGGYRGSVGKLAQPAAAANDGGNSGGATYDDGRNRNDGSAVTGPSTAARTRCSASAQAPVARPADAGTTGAVRDGSVGGVGAVAARHRSRRPSPRSRPARVHG